MVGAPPGRRAGALSRQGPDFGLLRVRQPCAGLTGRRKADGTIILAQLSADVIATLHVLAEIELGRRENVSLKARQKLDVLAAMRDDPVLK